MAKIMRLLLSQEDLGSGRCHYKRWEKQQHQVYQLARLFILQGGDYKITGTNADGSYKSEKVKKVALRMVERCPALVQFLTDFHGTQNKPEWIFNDSQLQNVLKSAVLSTINIATPKASTGCFIG